MSKLTARRKAWLSLFGVLASCALVFFVNPSEHTLIPCYFYTLTGYQCAGCGLTRATHHVFHAHWVSAWEFNPLVFIVLPLFGYGFVRYFSHHVFQIELPSFSSNRTLTFLAAAALIVFMIVRNIHLPL